MATVENVNWTKKAQSRVARLGSQTVRVGVTGLSGAGKTTFITSVINQLENHHRGLLARRIPFNRLISVRWQRVSVAQPFSYLEALDALSSVPARWPSSTTDLARVVIDLQFRPEGLLRKIQGVREVRIELLDYPGEWLLDLPLLGLDYGQWCAQMAALVDSEPRRSIAADLRLRLAAIDPAAPCDPVELRQLTAEWTAFILRCRTDAELSRNQPGRFMLPGSGIAADMLLFVPLLSANQHSDGPAGSWWSQCEQRFNYYRDFVVKGFYDEHFSRLDRQILLVDMLAPMQAGQAALKDLKQALEDVMGSFRYGRNSLLQRLFSPRISRMAICATKVDQVAPGEQRSLQQCLEDLVTDSLSEVRHGGVQVQGFPVSAVRAADQQGETMVGGLVGQTAFVRYQPVSVPRHLPLDLKLVGPKLLHLRPPANLHRNEPFPHFRMDDLVGWILEGKLL
ncbi:MAG: putative YcjX-like family ATPase [Halopseudomonas sp.]|jgi:predicted YcjX-like family ATPase|uniref:YcjX family protein n=1 Tax=Halopseudomonas sp. TaxID=2901191 RepID=UPI0039E2D59F